MKTRITIVFLWSLKQRIQGGFGLPFAIAFGLILALVGIMTLAGVSNNKVIGVSEIKKTQSLAVAEAGLNHILNLINDNRQMALYCSDCNTAVNWQNITDEVLTGNTANFCTDNTSSANSAVTEIQAIADPDLNNRWQNVDDNDTNKGQYRLVSYNYVPDGGGTQPVAPGNGTIVMEGRVDQNSQDTASASTSRITSTFPVKDSNAGSSTVPPGLWIRWDPSSDASGGVQINSAIQDSTCTSDISSSRVTKLKSFQYPPYQIYTETPGLAFPSLPAEGQNAPTGAIVRTKIGLSGATATLPGTGDTGVNNVYTYHFTDTSKSIDLSGESYLKIGTPGGNQTVILHLDGEMVLSGGSAVQIETGSHLIIYAHDKVTLSGGSTSGPIQNNGTPDQAEIYVYGANSVTLSGGSGMKLFLFAPDSPVTQSGSSAVEGTVWAKSWGGSGSGSFNQGQTVLANTKVGSIGQQNIKIENITSWKQCSVSGNCGN